MNSPTVISLFAGIGGICLGFKQAGFNIIWANEFDKYACRTYRHNFGDKYLVEGDIRKILNDDIPDFDVLTAGFPCQPFSIAGRQRGFDDDRGNLFFEITRIVDKKRPEVIFLENVPNLIRHDNEKTFLVIFSTLAQFGYDIRYAILSADKYGNVPQTRSRIYIVAFKNTIKCDRFEFPAPIKLTTNVSRIVDVHTRQNDLYYYNENDSILEKIKAVTRDEKGIIINMFGSNPKKPLHRICPTLVADMGRRNNRVPVVLDDYGYRKLTLRECLDFQGFPKEFYFPNTIKISDAYKQIGNSVCVPVVRRIAEEVKRVLR